MSRVKRTCDICYHDDYLIKIGTCTHKFCPTCIYDWLEYNDTCPTCRCEHTRKCAGVYKIRGLDQLRSLVG